MQKTGLWVSAGATIGITILSFLDWVTIGDGHRAEHFNLFSSWSQMNEMRSVFARRFGSVPGDVTLAWLLLSVLAIALMVSIALQIAALMKHHGRRDGRRLAYWAYGMAIIVPLGYIATATYANDSIDPVAPTEFFVLIIIAAIIGIVSNKDAKMQHETDTSRNLNFVPSSTVTATQPAATTASDFPIISIDPSASTESLIKRGQMFLADEDWHRACAYYERALDREPEHAPAYIGKLCGELHLNAEWQLAHIHVNVEDMPNFQKALNFADDTYKQLLLGYAESNRKSKLLQEAVDKTKSIQGLAAAILILEGIEGFNNANELHEQCVKLQADTYGKANKLLANGNYAEAVTLFLQLGNFQDSPTKAEQARLLSDEKQQIDSYSSAVSLLTNGDYHEASLIFHKLKNYQDSQYQAAQADMIIHQKQRQRKIRYTVAATCCITIIVAMLVYVNIVAPTIANRGSEAMGASAAGAISVSSNRIVGLRADGTVVASSPWAGVQTHPLADVSTHGVSIMSDIVAVSAGRETYGVTTDGRVVFPHFFEEGLYQVDGIDDILLHGSEWSSIVVHLSNGLRFVFSADNWNEDTVIFRDGLPGLYTTRDELVVWSEIAAIQNMHHRGGQGHLGYRFLCDVWGADWRNIVDISSGFAHIAGLRDDGSVVARIVVPPVGHFEDVGQANVGNWYNIIEISTGRDHTVGLRNDGTVVATGNNGEGQLNVDGWNDIVSISTGGAHTIGLRGDGTVVGVGTNMRGQLNVAGWDNIIAISTNDYLTAGLRDDGSVVVTSLNHTSLGSINIDEWQDIIAIFAGPCASVIGIAQGGVILVEYGDITWREHGTAWITRISEWQLFGNN